MSVYYTGKGDGGESHIGLNKISKTDTAMSALGDLDELNSLLGALKNRSRFKKILEDIQEDLFIIQANVAACMIGERYKPPVFSARKVKDLETLIGRFEKKLKPRRKFVIPGTNELSGWCDYARAVARRAERSVLLFSQTRKVSPEILAYLNRLSSLLFVMARIVGQASRGRENHPRYK